MKTSFFLLLIVSAFSCNTAGDPAKSTDQENIQGTWLAQTESLNGVEKKVSFRYVFDRDTITFTDETDKQVKYL